MPKLFLICTGLGIVKRGFETYIADLGEKLIEYKSNFETIIYSGGKHPISNQLFCLSRNNSFWIKLVGSKATADLELISFFFSLIVQIIFKKPTAIYLGEYKLYCYLFKTRKLLDLNFKLVLYTGGQVTPGLYDIQKDYVHHITDVYYSDLVKNGYPSSRQFIIPHFVNFNNQIDPTIAGSIRKMANGKKVVISVGVIDQTIKRMGTLVDILSINTLKYFPVLLGEYTNETASIVEKLERFFGPNNYFLATVSKSSLPTYLNEADVFVLLSPKESFGLAALEALSIGLPVICCNFKESRFVLKDEACLVNCSDEKLVLQTIEKAILTKHNNEIKENRKKFAHSYYSWETLAKPYTMMFDTILNSR